MFNDFYYEDTCIFAIAISILPFCTIKLEKEQDEIALFKFQKHTETENVDQLIITLYT